MREHLAQYCVFAESMVPICEYAMEGGPPPHPAELSSPGTNEVSGHPVIVLNSGTFGPALRIRRIEGPNLRLRNGRRSAAASSWAQFPRHQRGVRTSDYSTQFGNIWPSVAYSPNRGSQFAITQWKAVRRRIPLGSDLQAPNKGQTIC